MAWYIYILECQDGSFYTGVTDNLNRRFSEHKSGKGGHYTSYNPPKKICYYESFLSKTKACQREQQIKRWRRDKKINLISRFSKFHDRV